MASDSLSEVRDTAGRARLLAQALDAIESELNRLDFGADPGAVATALAGPVRAFDAAAKEAMR
jgi:hypothetical protein